MTTSNNNSNKRQGAKKNSQHRHLSSRMMPSSALCLLVIICVSVFEAEAFAPSASFVPKTTTKKNGLFAVNNNNNDAESSPFQQLKSRLSSTVVSDLEKESIKSSPGLLEPLTGWIFSPSAGKQADDESLNPAEWAFTFADLAPETPTTPAGAAFLATNLFYLAAGLGLLFTANDPWLGGWTEIASMASFSYHYQQLESGQRDARVVQMALLCDYMAAGVNILTAFGYAAYLLWLGSGLAAGGASMVDPAALEATVHSLEAGAVGFGFLLMSWKYERSTPYMVYHSLWHLFSAYAGYLVGTAFSMNAAAAGASTLMSGMM